MPSSAPVTTHRSDAGRHRSAGLWDGRVCGTGEINHDLYETCERCASGLICCSSAFAIGRGASYKYKRVGSELDAQTHTDPGIAMMGGGADLDEAFRWLCGKGNGGDFLILRASGKDDYNKYVNKLCRMNSVATLIIPNRKAAEEPRAARIIRQATVILLPAATSRVTSTYGRELRCKMHSTHT